MEMTIRQHVLSVRPALRPHSSVAMDTVVSLITSLMTKRNGWSPSSRALMRNRKLHFRLKPLCDSENVVLFRIHPLEMTHIALLFRQLVT